MPMAQPMLMSSPDNYFDNQVMIRLWLHESYRVYGDRLVNETDAGRFDEMQLRVSKNWTNSPLPAPLRPATPMIMILWSPIATGPVKTSPRIARGFAICQPAAMRVFVTGAGGFVGRKLLPALERLPEAVLNLGRCRLPWGPHRWTRWAGGGTRPTAARAPTSA